MSRLFMVSVGQESVREVQTCDVPVVTSEVMVCSMTPGLYKLRPCAGSLLG
jgi:hypothetical protein